MAAMKCSGDGFVRIKFIFMAKKDFAFHLITLLNLLQIVIIKTNL